MDVFRNEKSVYIEPVAEVKSYLQDLKNLDLLPLPYNLIYTPIISDLDLHLKNLINQELPSLYHLTSFYLLSEDILVFRGFMGAPATALFLEELIAIGVRNVVFLGLAGGLQKVEVGDLVLVDEALRMEGTSHHYLASNGLCIPSIELTKDISKFLTKKGISYIKGRVCTTDAPFRETFSLIRDLREKRVLAIEMEISAVFALAQYRKIQASALITISDVLKDNKWSGIDKNLFLGSFLSSFDYAIEFVEKSL